MSDEVAVSHGSDHDAQLSLAGFGPPRATDRLFFAVMPGPAAITRIEAVARASREQWALRGRPRPTAHLHVTLQHLGDYAGLPPDIVAGAMEAASAVVMAPFDVVLDRVGSFAGHRAGMPFVLRGQDGTQGVCQLHEMLATKLAGGGLRRDVERRFVPHVTLLYDTRRVPDHAVDAVCWTVREFVLIHSLLGRTEYRVLGRWPLDASWERGR